MVCWAQIRVQVLQTPLLQSERRCPSSSSSPSPSSEEQESTGPSKGRSSVRWIDGKSFEDLDKVAATSIYKLTFLHILKIFQDCGIGNVNRSTLFEYFRKLTNNYLPVFVKYHRVAYGIYSSPSVFSNSCAPNATRSSDGYRSDVRAIKEIKKGDPITICISRMDISREERRSFLETLLIDCKCERCSSNFDRGRITIYSFKIILL